jgi:DNA modification methylase
MKKGATIVSWSEAIELRYWNRGKLREVGTLWYKLKLAVLVASMHSHDGADVMKIGNWMKGGMIWIKAWTQMNESELERWITMAESKEVL